MALAPKIHLAVDLQKLDKLLPLVKGAKDGIELDLMIERERFDAVAELLTEYGIANGPVVQEFCYVLLWIEYMTGSGPDKSSYHSMWNELVNLKQYLLTHRVTSITLKGEAERDKPGEELVLKEEINLDRICDGLRTVFREEFDHDRPGRRTKGQTSWQRRRMIKVRNNILNYFTTVRDLDELDLQELNQLIDALSELAGTPN
jgi:hypothetical protein